MSHARAPQSDTPPPSPEQQRVARVTPPPSPRPLASHPKVASGLQVAGGLLNIAGAGFGAVAAQRQSADSNAPTAAYYGYACAAAWTLGNVATIASNHLARRAENTQLAHGVENRG